MYGRGRTVNSVRVWRREIDTGYRTIRVDISLYLRSPAACPVRCIRRLLIYQAPRPVSDRQQDAFSVNSEVIEMSYGCVIPSLQRLHCIHAVHPVLGISDG